MVRVNKKHFALGGLIGLFLFSVVVLWIHSVDVTVTREDRECIQAFLSENHIEPLPSNRTYEEELKFIHAVQEAVLKTISGWTGIPLNQSREPRAVYEQRLGLCYDRSRLKEKIYRLSGFPVRHVALYSTIREKYKWMALLKSEFSGHSISEIKTRKGWLVVDSNVVWISLDEKNRPVSLKEMQADFLHRKIKWSPYYLQFIQDIYKEEFVYVYGLYSRHGRFYPPFNRIPDISWGEFLQNIPNIRSFF